jgi:hypothetical protein
MSSDVLLFYYRVVSDDASEVYEETEPRSILLLPNNLIAHFLKEVCLLDLKECRISSLKVYRNVDDFDNRNTVKHLATKTPIQGLGSEEDPVILVIPKGILYKTLIF